MKLSSMLEKEYDLSVENVFVELELDGSLTYVFFLGKTPGKLPELPSVIFKW